MKKVVLIGIDGATPDLIENWMNKGKLPNFDKIRRNGTWGKLKSTIPPFSAPAWTSIVTGCKPGKHGIYGFEVTGTIETHLINSRWRKVPAIWNYLTDIGLKSIIINVPGSYPPEKINGVMITGLLTPSWDSDFTYPKDIKKRLEDKEDLGIYELETIWIDDLSRSRLKKKSPEKLLQKIMDQMTSRYNVGLKLMKESDWKFAMIVFRGTDTAQHFFFDNQDFLLRCYQKVDDFIGKIMKEYPDAIFFIVSDHGFEEIKKVFYPDNLLYNLKYLTPKHDPYKTPTSLLVTFFFKLCHRVLRLLPHWYLKKSNLLRKIMLTNASKGKSIDFINSKAFSTADGRGIQIYGKNKTHDEIINSEEYRKLYENIKKILLELRDPEDNNKIIEDVYHYEGLYGKDAVSPPDLVFELKKGVTAVEWIRFPDTIKDKMQSKERNIPYIFKQDRVGRSGDHAPYGIFFAFGKEIKPHFQVNNIEVQDVLPTVFNAMDIPVPDNIDGNIIKDIFINKRTVEKVDWNDYSTNKRVLKPYEIEKIKKLIKKINQKNN